MSSGKGDVPGFGKGDPQENFERMTSLARGPKGAKGERGERGLSSRTARAIVALFLINALGIAGNLYWTSRSVDSSSSAQQAEQAAQRQQAAAEQAAQQRAGAVVIGRLCKSLEPLAALAGLKPPAGTPANNPSRAYEQELSAKLAPLAQLGPDLGC